MGILRWILALPAGVGALAISSIAISFGNRLTWPDSMPISAQDFADWVNSAAGPYFYLQAGMRVAPSRFPACIGLAVIHILWVGVVVGMVIVSEDIQRKYPLWWMLGMGIVSAGVTVLVCVTEYRDEKNRTSADEDSRE
jgi:hypothetical protein